MSALPPKADILGGGSDVRFVPKADIEDWGGNTPDCNLEPGIASRCRPVQAPLNQGPTANDTREEVLVAIDIWRIKDRTAQ